MKVHDFPYPLGADLSGELHLISRPGGGELPTIKRPGFIYVDKYGKRYVCEKPRPHALYYSLSYFDSQSLDYPRIPSYGVFDQKRIEIGPLPRPTSGACGPARLYHWSQDNSVEINRGWIITGKTIRDLASQIDIPPNTLEDTVSTYNRHCERGLDPDFGRSSESLISLENPPFYAIRLWPGGANTQGGPKRNAKAQVLRPHNQVIPGLYSAGELGSIFGMLYHGGGNLAECIAFGRIAGENAARRAI